MSVDHYRYGYDRVDYASSVITNFAGDLVMTGAATPPRGSGTDILLAIFNAGVMDTIVHGGPGDESANDILQLTDGRYLLAGSTTSTDNDSSAGFLLLLSRDGRRVLQDRIIGGGKSINSVFTAMCRDNQDNVYLTGQEGDAMWVVKSRPDGEIVWSNTFRKKNPAIGTDVLMLPSGEIVVIGYSKDKIDYTGHFLRLTASGELIGNVDYKGDRPASMVLLANATEIVVTGRAPEERGDLLFLKINTVGEVLVRKAHHGPYRYANEDYGTGVWQDLDGYVHMVGANSSERRGMSRFKAWYSVYDEKGDSISSKLIGGKSEDVVYALYPISNDTFAVAGYTASGKGGGKQAWLLRVNLSPGVATDRPSVKCLSAVYRDGDGDGTLTFGEKSTIEFTFTNEAADRGTKLALTPIKELGSEVLTSSRLSLPYLPPGNRVSATIDVGLTREITEETITIRYQYANGKEADCPVTVPVGETPAPELDFFTSNSSENSTTVVKGDTSTFYVALRNTGNVPLTDIGLRFVFPDHVSLIEQPLVLENLKPDEELPLEIRYVVLPEYLNDSLQVRIVATGSEETYAEYQFETPVVIPAPPVRDTIRVSSEFLHVAWTKPTSELVKNGGVTTKDEFISLEAFVVSSHPIDESNIELYVNGDPVARGQKFRNVRLMPNGTDGRKNRYAYDFLVERLVLGTGENIVVLKASNGAGEYNTPPFTVLYAPEKPNLHLLSIGVPSNLKYTTKDAADFQNAFISQQGLLFEQVYSRLLTSQTETTATSMRKAIIDLERGYRTGVILDRDVVILFISTHGKAYSHYNSFRLADSSPGYDQSLYPVESSIDYEIDIIDRLKNIPCKVMIFIDACYSGGIRYMDAGPSAKSGGEPSPIELSRALNNLIEASSEIRTIASCQSDEQSYEDDKWENGAFSEALLEAFANVPVQVIGEELTVKANENDNVLTLEELYNFISARVPYLVSRKKDATTTQIPYLSEKYMKDSIPLFYFGKE